MQFLSIKQTCAKVGFSRSELRRKTKARTFPPVVEVGYRRFYVDDEVEDWMKERVAERDNLIAPAVREQPPAGDRSR